MNHQLRSIGSLPNRVLGRLSCHFYYHAGQVGRADTLFDLRARLNLIEHYHSIASMFGGFLDTDSVEQTNQMLTKLNNRHILHKLQTSNAFNWMPVNIWHGLSQDLVIELVDSIQPQLRSIVDLTRDDMLDG